MGRKKMWNERMKRRMERNIEIGKSRNNGFRRGQNALRSQL